MNVLIACEESQRVCIAFRNVGHNAFSCDILDCSGGHPEWHIKGDCLPLLNGNCFFETCDDNLFYIRGNWDLIIAHPPCTYLTNAANKYYNIEKYGDKAIERIIERDKASSFFMQFVNCNCKKVCIENPVGCMSTRYRKADQIIQPYFFGSPERKSTCLWLKGLPKLTPTKIVEPDIIYHKSGKTDSRLHYETLKLPAFERARIRSKTFPGVALAMAEQWG